MNLLLFPEDTWRLRRRADALPDASFGTPQLRQLGEIMSEIMTAHGGIGLASTQVDIDPCWRVVVVQVPGGGVGCLCNPEIVSHSGELWAPEGCLSFASVHEPMPAPEKLTVRYRKIDGTTREVECDASGSRVLWHELRHLDGRLMIDEMGTLQKRLFLAKVRKARLRRMAGEA